METIVAALIAATVAVLVAAVDRRLVAREEHHRWERTQRRQVYARFLGPQRRPPVIEGSYTPPLEQ